MSITQHNNWTDNALIVLKGNKKSEIRLVGFTPAGAGPQFYRQWKNFLPAHYQLESIALPGREHRIKDKLPRSMQEIVNELVNIVSRSMQTDRRPVVFFGHSFGALLAYKVCCQLDIDNLPMALIVSAHCAPMDKTPIGAIHTLPEEAFIQQLKNIEGLPSQVVDSPEYLDLVLPVIRSDLCIDFNTDMENSNPLSLPLLCLSANQDNVAPSKLMENWQTVTNKYYQHNQFDGGHFYIREHIEQVVYVIDDFVMKIFRKLD